MNELISSNLTSKIISCKLVRYNGSFSLFDLIFNFFDVIIIDMVRDDCSIRRFVNDLASFLEFVYSISTLLEWVTNLFPSNFTESDSSVLSCCHGGAQ